MYSNLDTYTKELGLYNPYDFDDGVVKPDPDTFYDAKISRTFHVSEMKEYFCVGCGGTEFKVGSRPYQTFLKCVKCEWETCVHSG